MPGGCILTGLLWLPPMLTGHSHRAFRHLTETLLVIILMQIKEVSLHMVMTCIESPFVIRHIYICLHSGVSLVKSAVEGPVRSVNEWFSWGEKM